VSDAAAAAGGAASGERASGERTEPSEHEQAVAWSSGGRTRFIVLRGPRAAAFDRFLVRTVGYSLITKQYALAMGQRYQPTLLLQTIGRRTGLRRTRALPFHVVGDDLVVVGSRGGGPLDPDWAWNVRANGAAWVCVRRRWRAVDAHVAEGDERAALFAELTGRRASIRRYQERASTYGRQIPLVVLRPKDGRPLA
jgi:deazaflavin-dependent oxidoreductase (nitroreductase family)